MGCGATKTNDFMKTYALLDKKKQIKLENLKLSKEPFYDILHKLITNKIAEEFIFKNNELSKFILIYFI